jgi:CRP/FNR family cyclic AMP-dependent transcriptional regulator
VAYQTGGEMDKFISDNFKNIEKISFKKNEMILRPYEDTKYVYEIESGLVKVYGFDSRNKENIAVIYGSGDLFPLAWVIDSQRPSVYFRAISESVILLIPKKLLQEGIKQDAELLYTFMLRTVRQFALFSSTVKNLGLKYGRERLAYKLLVLMAKFGVERDGHIIIPYINHTDLGVTINMTRESVSKEISRLVRLQVVEYSRSEIVIKSPEGLQNEIGKDVQVMFFDEF